MRIALVTAMVTVTAGAALAQKARPELRWQGYISDGAVLYIQGDRVDVQGRSTGSVDRIRTRFNSPLPQADQRVIVNVRRGGGRVEVVEQPTASNNYTAEVQIEPGSIRGPELYDLAFQWDRNARARYGGYGEGTRSRTADYYGTGEMTWSGSVDHEALIVITGNQVNVRTVRGRRVLRGDARFASALPRTGVNVRLADVNGRGNVELIEQPDARNNYSAVVRITDEPDGAGQYAFRLAWDQSRNRELDPWAGDRDNQPVPYRANQGGVLTPSDGYLPAGTMRWAGTVDDRIRVTIRGNQVWSTRLSGAVTQNEQAAFGSALPRSNVNADVRLLQGRGEVSVVEQPSARNGYQLVLEIRDSSAGADNYELEVIWR